MSLVNPNRNQAHACPEQHAEEQHVPDASLVELNRLRMLRDALILDVGQQTSRAEDFRTQLIHMQEQRDSAHRLVSELLADVGQQARQRDQALAERNAMLEAQMEDKKLILKLLKLSNAGIELRQQRDKLRAACRDAFTAMNAWTVRHAPEYCHEEHVKQSEAMIFGAGGTLAYIANVAEKLRHALALDTTGAAGVECRSEGSESV